MYLSIALLFLCVATSSATSIIWSDCKLNSSLPIVCGTLSVPLDYTNTTSNRTINLQLVKLPATQQPSKGSVLLNPGGPGIGGRNFVLEIGEAISLITGPHYDLIGFDPRGTGETIPFTCYSSAVLETTSVLLSPAQLNSSDTAPGTIWATKGMVAEACYERAGEIGELIGTGFVARDMMQIVDALDEDGLLRYYGFSYGTALGATVAAMYPDRMDKIVLDGVLNVDQYYSGRGVQQVIDSDSVYEGFFKGCVETPHLCALAKHGASAEDLMRKIGNLLEETKYHPIPLGPNLPIDLVNYQALKTSIELSLYNPSEWPALSVLFDAVFTKNLTAYVETYTALIGIFGSGAAVSFPTNPDLHTLLGIRCSDSFLRADNLSAIEPILRQYETASYIIGDAEPVAVTIPCVQWKFHAKGRYTGGFNDVKTKNPVLFVGNTHDPLTPLASAKNTSAGFPGSGLLTVNAYGHTSTSQPSLCAAKAIRAYFDDGTLPDNGTICQPSVPLFRPPSESLQSVLQPLNHTRRSDGEEDMRLLHGLGRIQRAVASRRRSAYFKG